MKSVKFTRDHGAHRRNEIAWLPPLEADQAIDSGSAFLCDHETGEALGHDKADAPVKATTAASAMPGVSSAASAAPPAGSTTEKAFTPPDDKQLHPETLVRK